MTQVAKTLWVVNYNSVQEFLAKAVAVGATAVAIRTDNNISAAIPLFHARNIQVFGWRWPSAKRDAAMKEAAKVVGLLAEGLDGYYVDPEGDPGKPWDWNQKGLESLAEDFCSAIKTAAPDKPFGTTSHYRINRVFPDLPRAIFFKYSDVFLPQAYWRSTDGVIGHGMPADNYAVALDFWRSAGADPARIVPMAGEIAVATAAEIGAYAAAAATHDIPSLHFYAFEDDVRAAVWNAIARA
jgi:hypothetical protein